MMAVLARPPAAQAARAVSQRAAAGPRRWPAEAAAALPPPPRRRAASAAAAADSVPPEQQAAAAAAAPPDSSTAGSSGASTDAAWRQAQLEIQAQQAAGLHEAYPLDKTRQLVETAMLAAITGLAYTVGHLLRLEGYLAYGLPLPVVLAALRSGPGAAVKTLATTCLLLLILMGPVRAATYLLVYGVLSLALGLSWAARLPWGASVPLGALARIAGYFAYIGLSSWLTNENLVALMVTNVYSLLDQLSGVLGTSGAPPPLAVAVVLASLLFVNSLMYVALMHVLYAIMLRALGLGQQLRTPKFMERFVASSVPAT